MSSGKTSNRQKVAIIAPCPFPAERGTPLRILKLASWLSNDFDVHVITFHLGGEGDYPFTIHRTPWLPLDIEKAGPNLTKIVCDPLLFLKALWVIARQRIRLIDGHLHEGALIALMVRFLLGGRTALYNAHGTFVPELIATGWVKESSWLVKPLRWFEGFVERRVDGIVAQSPMRKEEFAAKGIPPSRVAVIEDAPDLEACWTEEADPGLNQRLKPNGETVFLYVGGMAEYQGVDLIFEAFQRLRKRRDDIRLVCFGRPAAPYRAKARTLAIEESVVFEEEAGNDQLAQYFRLCDVALAPRLYGENVPMKVPMYMAGGMAIIGSDTKGINTVLAHGETGWLVAPGDVQGLEQAMALLASDKGARERLGASARKVAEERYEPSRVKDNVARSYKRLAE